MIHLIESTPTPQQLAEMLEELEDYVKLAVDIEQGVAAGGGALHADCDLQLTLMASSLYRLFGAEIANGYETAKSRHIFRDFIDATAEITISAKEVLVKFQKRAHNPFLLASGFGDLKTPVPWWGDKNLRFQFG
jgi:hypothetical protein